ncbi:aconitase X swivel domain-containing protein [Ornithinimicrobium cavernae]|uniref:aconitase X swivel domain-containing protein n=1 Tax=Ornithinimicrobium cavernae TaxID=2666047 RepID=UPI000D6964AD|nr:DUF126 domain-containing protein [Ornithinimicrobium cavernae]
MTRSSAEHRTRTWTGRTLHAGHAEGALLKLDLPLSFWGGAGHDGTIIDRHHPQCGQQLSGRVLAMTSGRGSSSSSSVLAELLRAGVGPAALVMTEPDAIVVLGALVASELYDLDTPVIQLDPADFADLQDGAWTRITGGASTVVQTITPGGRPS